MGWEVEKFEMVADDLMQDTNPIFWKTKLEKGEFSNVTSELV